MTSTEETSAEALYQHPNIRDMALRTIQERTEQRRNRRLLVAVETNQLKIKKLENASEKDRAKFEKLMTGCEKKLDQVADLLRRVEDDLASARLLDNSMTLIGHELGQ